ncbi:citryl-CoA lyase [bacterium]|nr:citryl-CoA lyase [bacterium]
MSDYRWKTAITKVQPNKISVRGYPVDQMMGKVSFAQAIYLLLKGKMPSRNVGKMMDAILVSSIDHGASPPSVLAARTVASTGSELNSSVAAGVLAISRYHGGAIEEGMKLFIKIAQRMEERNITKEEASRQILQEMKKKGKRASGFGHRLHKSDPRKDKLFSMAEELKIAGKYVRIVLCVEKELEKMVGRSLPINVDGAIAALLCDLEFPPQIGNAFFVMARVPGLVAHVHEEKTRMKPMRKIHPQDFEYDGPEEKNK